MNTKSLLLALLLCSVANAQPALRSSLSQFGITWKFDKEYVTGQFVNGDYWVIGPVTVVEISPQSVEVGGRTKNGSMVNPSPKKNKSQGYDSALGTRIKYDPTVNVALNLSASKPLKITPSSSLVSTISIDAAGNAPQIKTAAVLTVVSKAPPAGSFRPAYCGKRQIQFNKSQLDYSKLKKLRPVAGTPSLASMERAFERPWLDYFRGWSGNHAHPDENMPWYGRNLAAVVGEGALMLNLDVSDTLKEKLLIRYVQVGIDLYGCVEDGGKGLWYADGGTASGRKFPILFAGVLLGHSGMSNIGHASVAFGEDQQTFYVEETKPGVYNHGHGGYKKQHVGMAEYGIRHAYRPQLDNVSWDASYRQCCTANSWVGFVLAARIMGLKEKWNHDALFDYQDRYISECRRRGIRNWKLSWSKFNIIMWDVYRKAMSAPGGLTANVGLADAFDKPAGLPDPKKKVVRLAWTQYGNGSEVSYNLYRRLPDDPLQLLKQGLRGTSYVDVDVETGTTYTYVLRAVQDRVESPPSQPVQVSL